jgi:hypothetical protein
MLALARPVRTEHVIRGGLKTGRLPPGMIGLGSYGKTLTVLYGIELPDEDDQDDDSLQESWTPRFRR